jgi:hypothetical protein
MIWKRKGVKSTFGSWFLRARVKRRLDPFVEMIIGKRLGLNFIQGKI